MNQINIRPELVAAMKKAIVATLKQNKKSQMGTTCAYRSEAGCCIVGHMISNGFYQEHFEGKTPKDEYVSQAVFGSIDIDVESVHNDEIIALTSLQKIHDFASSTYSNFNFGMVHNAIKRRHNPIDQFTSGLFLDTFCEYMTSEEN